MSWRPKASFGMLELDEYTVATLPAAADHTNLIVYCSNGNAGQESLVRSDGTNWVSLATGATAAAA